MHNRATCPAGVQLVHLVISMEPEVACGGSLSPQTIEITPEWDKGTALRSRKQVLSLFLTENTDALHGLRISGP